MCAISVFLCSQRARKCEIKHWFTCGTDGQAVYGHVITKFSVMGRFAYPWCSAGALRAQSSVIIKLLVLCLAFGLDAFFYGFSGTV